MFAHRVFEFNDSALYHTAINQSELVGDVAVPMSVRQAVLFWALRSPDARPRLNWRRSSSTVLSQVCLGRPGRRLQFLGAGDTAIHSLYSIVLILGHFIVLEWLCLGCRTTPFNSGNSVTACRAGVKCEVWVCEVRCEVGCDWSVASGSPRTLPNGN